MATSLATSFFGAGCFSRPRKRIYAAQFEICSQEFRLWLPPFLPALAEGVSIPLLTVVEPSMIPPSCSAPSSSAAMASAVPSRGQAGYLMVASLLALAGISFRELRLSTAAAKMDATLAPILDRPVHPVNQFRLREVYTGFPSVDLVLRFLEGVFLPGAAGWDRPYQVHQAYFLLSFTSVMAVWMVDGGRQRSAWKLTSFTSLWAILYSVIGGAVVAPFYSLAYLYESTKPGYFSRASQRVPLPYAKAILPSLLLGYVLPTLAWYYSYADDPTLQVKQVAISCWHVSPLLTNALLYLFRRGLFTSSGLATAAKDEIKAHATIRRTYLLLAAFCAAVHWWAVAACLTERSSNPAMEIWPLFLRRLPGGFRDDWTWRPFDDGSPVFYQAVHWIFQVDTHAVFVTALVGGVQALWDVQRANDRGKTSKTTGIGSVALASVLASFAFGPAATILGLAWQREGLMMQMPKNGLAKR